MLSNHSWRVRGSRQRWIGAGLAATGYLGLRAAASPLQLIAAVVIYQIALNMMLTPLLATMADAVLDGCKGLAGGLLTPAQPVAALLGPAIIWSSIECARFEGVLAVRSGRGAIRYPPRKCQGTGPSWASCAALARIASVTNRLRSSRGPSIH